MTSASLFTLLPKQVIGEKLQAISLSRGVRPGEGDVITILQIAKHLHISNHTLLLAKHGVMSDRTQIILSRFFEMWEQGRVRFVYRKKGGWSTEYPDNPIPRHMAAVTTQIILGESGPRLHYRREE